jgi:hypothetical protein
MDPAARATKKMAADFVDLIFVDLIFVDLIFVDLIFVDLIFVDLIQEIGARGCPVEIVTEK